MMMDITVCVSCGRAGFGRRPLAYLLLLVASACPHGCAAAGHPVALVLPVEGTSHLAVQREGVDLLNSLNGSVAPVVVIGPYRSGKSFTLNQLLGVSCDEGFGVGHTRMTETKGIWLWSEPPVKHLPDGSSTSLLYVDTEGFESTGKSNSYDDRVFAVSAILSSLLIYNLPETIRESDIGKLSFAVELANGLYERGVDGGTDGGTVTPGGTPAATTATATSQQLQQLRGKAGSAGAQGAAALPLPGDAARAGQFEPGAMLWLIQRDFLQGKTASDVVAEALSAVPNPGRDSDIEQTNAIRASLSAIAADSTGWSLAQPHLDRIRLCELPDSELDPKYVAQRDGLQELVNQMAKPKIIGGQPSTGPVLAGLVGRLVDALNVQEIPNAASMLDVFNRDVVAKAVHAYRAALGGLTLPMDEEDMQEVEHKANAAAHALFSATVVGRKRGEQLAVELAESVEREWRVKKNENLAASNQLCSELESGCEGELDQLQGMRLPSVRKFNATFAACRAAFEQRCKGPARPLFDGRLIKALARAQATFNKDYNDRLYTGLLFLFLGCAVFFRFILLVKLLEAVCWAAFVALELYPHLQIGGSMYETQWWRAAAHVWEALMYALFGFRGEWVLWLVAVCVLVWYSRRRGGSGGGGGARGKKRGAGSGTKRDLDV
ncbi:hypothetical protein FOA52_003728 [Chlamydomonas sp. UWO 241]|nr:hypothetical protein FOA52_003728 [Chlamydomonas sp. UWO 241]